MIQCSTCSAWVHARCEELTGECSVNWGGLLENLKTGVNVRPVITLPNIVFHMLEIHFH